MVFNPLYYTRHRLNMLQLAFVANLLDSNGIVMEDPFVHWIILFFLLIYFVNLDQLITSFGQVATRNKTS